MRDLRFVISSIARIKTENCSLSCVSIKGTIEQTYVFLLRVSNDNSRGSYHELLRVGAEFNRNIIVRILEGE